MKRIAATLIGVLCIAVAGAQELKIGTIEGMANFSPLVVKVLKEAGYGVKVVTFPQQGALMQELAKGSVDGAFFLAEPLIAQVKAIRVPVRIGETDFCALVLDSSIKISSPGDLRKYTVGIVKGNAGHEAITRGVAVTAVGSDVEQFKGLASGRYQVIISIPQMIPVMCKIAGIKEYFIQKPPVLKTPTYFALSASQFANRARVEAAFQKWVDNGQWEKEAAAINK